ncbi:MULTISPECIES: hypothetical protein [Colwellia]|jgi:hypothetical protein|uniref:Uncharacterized protein n=1 Tax=Colwellia psychrerythraea (strain 34H / ATCC BAA-681) TaxID=167879 RepID=Q487A8_COLP3|nr:MULTISPECIES: hypothetical protein [Colwellia]AAZ25568.1 hypothetical protein CPS_1113 [Colwellia psychrerythraea 34H]PKH89368.1 hypothetical protein CXF79_00845 [Colwellia sp. Bg11-28]
MFTKITHTTDSLLSNEGVTSLIVNDALRKISQLTGLSQQQAFALLSSQVTQQYNNTDHREIIKVQAPLLEQKESQFISSLFN